MDVAVHQLGFELQHELLDHLHDDFLAQGGEVDHCIQTVAEFGRESPLDRGGIFPGAAFAAKADGRLRLLPRARVRGHDQDHVAEVHRPAIVVGQLAVVHHLQQDVVDIRVRLFHFVQKKDAMRVLVHAIGQHAALVKPDIARRRADQTGNRVLFHVFRHVEADQFHAKRRGKLLCHLGLADARRPGEEVVADGLFRFAQAGTRQLDGRAERGDRLVLTEDHALEGLFQIAQGFRVVLRDGLRGNSGDLGDHSLDLFHAQRFPALGVGQQMLCGPGFVDHVDRRVRQLAVVDVARGQLHRRLDRVVGVFQVVVFLEMRFQTHQDLDRIRDRRLVHVDLLEAPGKRPVLFEVLTEFLVGGRAHAAQLAALQRGFQQVGRIHRAATGRASADHGVNLVDEEDRVGVVFKFLDDLLQPFLEVAAVAGASQKRAHVEAEDRGLGQNLGCLAVDNLAGEAFGNRGLAHAGVAHQKGVVLAAAAEDLDRTLHLGLTPNQRVDVALAGLHVQVDAVFGKRRFLGFASLGLGRFMRFVRALNGTGFAIGRVLRHAMRDEVDRVVARHVLFLQEVGSVGFPFGEDRDQDVRAGHFGAAGGLDVNRRALDHALESGGGDGFAAFDIGHQRRQVVVDEVGQGLAKVFQIDGAGLHHAGCVGFFDQGQQKMLQRGEFMTARVGQGQSAVDCLFKRGRKRWHFSAPVLQVSRAPGPDTDRGLISLKFGFLHRTSSAIFQILGFPPDHHADCDKRGSELVFSGPDFGKHGDIIGIWQADCCLQGGQVGPQIGVRRQLGRKRRRHGGTALGAERCDLGSA